MERRKLGLMDLVVGEDQKMKEILLLIDFMESSKAGLSSIVGREKLSTELYKRKQKISSTDVYWKGT